MYHTNNQTEIQETICISLTSILVLVIIVFSV